MEAVLLISSSLDSFLELIGVLLIFVFILVITYLCSKWMAGYQKMHMKSKNLQIIESIPAGNNKAICLVKAGTEYLVVGIGKDEIQYLATLSEEQLTDFSFREEKTTGKEETFQEIFGQFRDKMSKK
ncbi:MAG: flagellar biogenesis protein [Lachnospiraceae bacterium]|nr:flagellar biogenesis protein [Lachnospiraceae bacterium]MBO5097969.1 flagellar biosynthetic protein FliO [Agathobacter sp.]